MQVSPSLDASEETWLAGLANIASHLIFLFEILLLVYKLVVCLGVDKG